MLHWILLTKSGKASILWRLDRLAEDGGHPRLAMEAGIVLVLGMKREVFRLVAMRVTLYF